MVILKNIAKQNLAKALGNRIKEFRINAGLTQKELAERCGMLEPNIGAIERGTNTPTLPTLVKISDALEVDLVSLLDGLHELLTITKDCKEVELLDKIGFTVLEADEHYLIVHNASNPFAVSYPKKKLQNIISNIVKECEKQKQKSIEEKIGLFLLADFLNNPFDILSIVALDTLSVETATKLLQFAKEKEAVMKKQSEL